MVTAGGISRSLLPSSSSMNPGKAYNGGPSVTSARARQVRPDGVCQGSAMPVSLVGRLPAARLSGSAADRSRGDGRQGPRRERTPAEA